jgi:hypothetical protein
MNHRQFIDGGLRADGGMQGQTGQLASRKHNSADLHYSFHTNRRIA